MAKKTVTPATKIALNNLKAAPPAPAKVAQIQQAVQGKGAPVGQKK